MQLIDTINKSLNKNSKKLKIINLWKLFGKKADLDVDINQIDKKKSKQDILQESGLVVALQDVSLDIKTGETFVIMGLSGSGKSTLLRCINRLINPTYGQVLIDDIDVALLDKVQLQEFRREKMSMVFQHFALLPFRTIIDNVAFGLELRGMEKYQRRKKARQMLEMVGLEGWDKYYPSELSGGMQQRVGLARALTTEPDILLLDEPFSALDPLIRREMQDEFVKLSSKVNKTVIFVTHDLNEAVKLGDRIAIMQDGKIIQLGTARDIITKPSNDYVRNFVQDVPKTKVLTARNIMTAPNLLLNIRTSPAKALEEFERKSETVGFVVDDNDYFQGIIQLDTLKEIAQRNRSLKEAIMREGFVKARAEHSFEDLLTKSVGSNLPLVIIKSDGKFQGIVDKDSILRELASNSE